MNLEKGTKMSLYLSPTNSKQFVKSPWKNPIRFYMEKRRTGMRNENPLDNPRTLGHMNKYEKISNKPWLLTSQDGLYELTEVIND